ncbi:hypothetical protein A3H09_01310 [Candidatus Falkowbacteria bacterium RIFCSPLOWO2_12_FULL_45_13]|uniref:Uncharacterized protein n=2 Tax=Candidatus Falkowiibacteriota TaxID=1752728 RepID=A0A1F5SCJ0_9BACT|nr:MAG: hypothetical protein A3H66_03115 [Candidatus Falkowbacteria bacterium RIFCSPLOWO2_02_FULL_45_21]OGF32056.1 MAG: hypothetical protein A3H09_01310 [Candidatus Falkowbacteria bacterium RIFCSPLOWO2_12_FULL_45_13]
MKIQHENLAAGGWAKLSLPEQLANIGSEVERALKWQARGNHDYSQKAFFRSLELLSLSLDGQKNGARLKELARLYEALVDYFQGENIFSSSASVWRKYFYAFNWLARK